MFFYISRSGIYKLRATFETIKQNTSHLQIYFHDFPTMNFHDFPTMIWIITGPCIYLSDWNTQNNFNTDTCDILSKEQILFKPGVCPIDNYWARLLECSFDFCLCIIWMTSFHLSLLNRLVKQYLNKNYSIISTSALIQHLFNQNFNANCT
jgi:hypothetical protein